MPSIGVRLEATVSNPSPLSRLESRTVCKFERRRSTAHSDSHFIQPRARNRILSCSAIASAVALALPSSVLLPLASP